MPSSERRWRFHSELGAGFLEPVYQEAMELELTTRGVPFRPTQPLRVKYKGQVLKKEYVADLVCHGQIIVELKALDRLTGREEAQALNYLKATGLRVELLMNFGDPSGLQWKRLVNHRARSRDKGSELTRPV